MSTPLRSGPRARVPLAFAVPLAAAMLATVAGAVALLSVSRTSGVGAGLAILGLLVALIVGAAAVVRRSVDREVSRVRRAISTGLAHELRTPLAQIRMFTEMILMDRYRSADERSEWMRSIDRESHRLGDVLENVLLFIHGGEAEPFPVRKRVDLGTLVDDVSAAFVSRAAGRGSRIEADPPLGTVVLADPSSLRQVVVNLLDHALRSGPRGQTIRVEMSADEAETTLRVSYDGAAIPVTERADVWLRAAERPGDRDRFDGELGLAVVRRVVELHGGRSWFEATEGGSECISVALPLCPAEGSSGTSQPEAALSARG